MVTAMEELEFVSPSGNRYLASLEILRALFRDSETENGFSRLFDPLLLNY